MLLPLLSQLVLLQAVLCWLLEWLVRELWLLGSLGLGLLELVVRTQGIGHQWRPGIRRSQHSHNRCYTHHSTPIPQDNRYERDTDQQAGEEVLLQVVLCWLLSW